MTSLDDAQSRAPTAAIRDFLRRSISMSDVLRQIWSGRLIVIAGILVGGLYGIYEAHRAGPQFTASMSILPAQPDTDGGAAAGAVGLLAGLTGGSFGAGQVPKFTQFMAALGSVGVANELNRKYDMLCYIYRGECDLQTHQWRERTGIREWINGMLARLGGLPNPNGPRTTVDLAQYNFGNIRNVKDKVSGLVTLSFSNRDPRFAADYLGKVVRVTNDYIRNQDRQIQREYVRYVSERVGTSSNIVQRETLSNLLLQQERKLMMTEVNVPYAVTILDGPTVVPLNSVRRVLVLDAFFGFLFGVAFALARGFVPHRLRFWSAT